MNAQSDVSAPARQVQDGGDDPVMHALGEWVASVGTRVQASTRLVMAETELALVTFLVMILLTVLAAGALLFTWAFLMAAMLQLLQLSGLPLAGALGALSLAHLIGAWLIWRLANRMTRYLKFAETRRLLTS